MALLDHLLKQLDARGLKVAWVSGDVMTLSGKRENITPELLAALKSFKRDLLAKFRPEGWEALPPPKDFRKAADGPDAPVLPAGVGADPAATGRGGEAAAVGSDGLGG